jgi:hypothetical protein
MVEFALVAPLFFLLLFGIIEGGRLIFYLNILNNATRDGARYAIVHGSNAADGCPSGPMPGGVVNPCDPAADNVRDAVRTSAFGVVAPADFAVLDVDYSPANDRGDLVRVYVEYVYDPILPLAPSFPISAESTLVINN